MAESVIVEKTYQFALRIVKLYVYLTTKPEYILSKKVLDNGTDVGAHVKAAQEAESRGIFANEMSVALRKASKTEFFLQLLHDGGFLEEKEFTSIHADCLEILKILTAICKTTRPRNPNE